MGEEEHVLVEKISISGATLASILQRFSSSPGDVDGLLFGHFNRLPPPDPNDDDPSSSSSSSSYSYFAGSIPFSALITGHFCSGAPITFCDSIGRVNPHSLRRASQEDRLPILLGWFSARRRTALRPSMREIAFSNSLFETLTLTPHAHSRPCIFLLLSFSSTENQAIHTHEYRAFHFRRNPFGTAVLQPRSLHIVNIGPDFRGQYGSFSPDSALPLMPFTVQHKESLQDSAATQLLLDSVTEGFTVERLAHLVGPGVDEYALELEDFYRKMLLKLEGLARLVEKSSARVLEQENKNLKMRCRLAGLE